MQIPQDPNPVSSMYILYDNNAAVPTQHKSFLPNKPQAQRELETMKQREQTASESKGKKTAVGGNALKIEVQKKQPSVEDDLERLLVAIGCTQELLESEVETFLKNPGEQEWGTQHWSPIEVPGEIEEKREVSEKEEQVDCYFKNWHDTDSSSTEKLLPINKSFADIVWKHWRGKFAEGKISSDQFVADNGLVYLICNFNSPEFINGGGAVIMALDAGFSGELAICSRAFEKMVKRETFEKFTFGADSPTLHPASAGNTLLLMLAIMLLLSNGELRLVFIVEFLRLSQIRLQCDNIFPHKLLIIIYITNMNNGLA